MIIHNLKTIQPYFDQVDRREKTFEVRKNDRNFGKGDYVLLQEYNTVGFTGDEILCRITYVLHGGQFGIEEGYCVFGINIIG